MPKIEKQNKEENVDSKTILPENAVEWAMLFRYN
jgi:hypothetical protein